MTKIKEVFFSEKGIYLGAALVGFLAYLIDIFILNIIGFVVPNMATWLDEALLLTAVSGLIAFAWKKYGLTWQAIPLMFIGIIGFNSLALAGIALTIDTYKAEVVTAGIDESNKGVKNIFTSKIISLDENNASELHRAQDSFWWTRSADTRALLIEAKNTNAIVCVTEYGIRNGFIVTLYPNIVAVYPEKYCG